jgi:hypothetical protein
VADLGSEYTPSEATLNRIFDRLESRIRSIIVTSADSAANAVGDQLEKAKAEIDAVIAELQDQSVTDATIERLQRISQSFDDENPDAPTPEPTPEPEPAPEPEPEPTPEP